MSVEWDSLRDADRPEGDLAMTAYLDMPDPVPTGIGKLDQLLGGGMARGVTVVGGESSAGKTALACQAAAMMCARGQRVAYASYETAWEVVQLRCASAWSLTDEAQREGVEAFSWSAVVNGGYRLGHPEYAGKGRQELSRYLVGGKMDPVAYALTKWDEGPGRNLAVLTDGYEVGELTEAVSAVEGQRPVLVVDYIQIVPSGAPQQQTDTERVTDVMRALREHAYSPAGGHVLAISSLRKLTPSERKDGPSLDWFKSSNNVGYDAEQAVMLTCDMRKDQEGHMVRSTAADGGTEVRLTSVKNRTGSTGTAIPAILYGWCSMLR